MLMKKLSGRDGLAPVVVSQIALNSRLFEVNCLRRRWWSGFSIIFWTRFTVTRGGLGGAPPLQLNFVGRNFGLCILWEDKSCTTWRKRQALAQATCRFLKHLLLACTSNAAARLSTEPPRGRYMLGVCSGSAASCSRSTMAVMCAPCRGGKRMLMSPLPVEAA